MNTDYSPPLYASDFSFRDHHVYESSICVTVRSHPAGRVPIRDEPASAADDYYEDVEDKEDSNKTVSLAALDAGDDDVECSDLSMIMEQSYIDNADFNPCMSGVDNVPRYVGPL